MLSQHNAWPTSLKLRLKGVSTLTIVRKGGKLVGLPDPWLGKTVELSINGTPYFMGDVTDADPHFSEVGWVVSYQCRSLRDRGDRVPFTDSNTRSDSAAWNLAADDALWLAVRSGRSAGQILADALTMPDNAAALDARGIGAYVSLSPPTLPAATLADLAAMTVIPPQPAYVRGEKLVSALESFLSAWAPNYAMHIRPDGVIRFLDLRSTVNHTLTLEVDPIEPTPLRRSVADCFQRVVVRGQTTAEPKLLTLQNGGLEEDFGWGTLSNAAAKAAWTPEAFEQDSGARSQGSLSVTDPTHVVLTSDPGSQAWAVNEWDQTNRLGVLYAWSTIVTGVDQYVARRVVANTAKAGGGSSSFTLDAALPSTDYDKYALYGVSSGASFVWRKYKIADPAVAAALARQFTYPVPFVGANGDVAYMTSSPVGTVNWSPTGLPPYSEAPLPFAVNTATGHLVFASPTYKLAGGQPPSDVRALLAVNTGTLAAVKPATGHEGTSHTVEGMQETLVVTVDSWRDPANQAPMEAYAQDLLDSVKDTIVEGSVVYRGLYLPALDFGIGLSITGSTYTTGWEGLNLPVLEVDLTWNNRSGTHYTTTMTVSNRKAHYSSGAFLRPERQRDDGLVGGELGGMSGARPTRAVEGGGDRSGGSTGGFGLGGATTRPNTYKGKGGDFVGPPKPDPHKGESRADRDERINASQAEKRAAQKAKNEAGSQKQAELLRRTKGGSGEAVRVSGAVQGLNRWKNQADPRRGEDDV